MNCNELKNKIEENDFQSKNKFNILLTEKLSDYNKLLRIKEEEIFYLRNKVLLLRRRFVYCKRYLKKEKIKLF